MDRSDRFTWVLRRLLWVLWFLRLLRLLVLGMLLVAAAVVVTQTAPKGWSICGSPSNLRKDEDSSEDERVISHLGAMGLNDLVTMF
jgi:hypothetical protein